MATDVEIASLALTRIGHDSIASFSASGDKAQRWFYANYEMIKRSLLREYEWRFALKRAVLTADTIRTITGATQTSPVVVTSASHGFSNGAEVYIDSIIGMSELNGRTFTVANAATDTFELSGEDGTDHTAYASGGYAYGYIAKEYRYRFEVPSDCLRVLRVNRGEDVEYRLEAGYIYTDESVIDIEYIFDVTDDDTFDAQFTDLLASRLSAEVAFYLTDNSTATEQAWNIYQQKLQMARSMDTRQGTPRGLDADLWLMARY